MSDVNMSGRERGSQSFMDGRGLADLDLNRNPAFIAAATPRGAWKNAECLFVLDR